MYEDLNPQEVPEDLSLFDINEEKYPLLGHVSEFIQSANVKQGDCIYVPNFWFYQHVSNEGNAIFMNFEYESSSKLSELFIEAVHEGILEQHKSEMNLPNLPTLD